MAYYEDRKTCSARDATETMVQEFPDKGPTPDAPGSTEIAMRVGAVAASLISAGAAWLLGGGKWLVAAVGGITAAAALPYIGKATGPVETAPGEPSTTSSQPAQGGSAPSTLPEESELTDVSLGNLTPISELLPATKTHTKKSRPSP